MSRLLSALAISGCLLVGMPAISLAQGLPGFTLFGGPSRGDLLNYRLERGTAGFPSDRYRLRIPARKMQFAISQLSITYPNYYDGEFDQNRIEVRVKGKSVPLDEVIWNQEDHFVEIYPSEPIAAGQQVEVIFHNVRNPKFGGMYHFNARIRTPGDTPLYRYLGTWVLSIQ